MRLRPSERSELDDLYSLYVANSSKGVRVPLSQIASFERQIITPKIRRRDHERCITVRCDVVNGVLPSDGRQPAPEQVLPAQASVTSGGGADAGQDTVAFPVGYKWEFGGEKFEQDKGFRSLAIALIVSFAAIYLALVVQFNSVTQPLLVYAAVPFGVVGGLLGLAVMGSSFGFMAFLGVASLAGPDHLARDRALRLHRRDEAQGRAAAPGGGRCRPGAAAPGAHDRARVRRRPDPAGDGRRPAVGADVLRPDRRACSSPRW